MCPSDGGLDDKEEFMQATKWDEIQKLSGQKRLLD